MHLLLVIPVVISICSLTIVIFMAFEDYKKKKDK